jgi:hypothetical protein|tara:strand:- start:80 stop:562 length:483 start_codon:yes stop_codon:yes gene_type:complete
MFTKAEFLSNEDNNYHTENGVEMAREFGTPEELELMLRIQKDHYARGHIQPDEIEARRGIVNKYWKHLEKVGSVTDSIEEDEERGADFYRAQDAANMQHAKVKLEKLIRELDVDILWRGENSRKFFNNGDRAGTGQLGSIVDKLRDINKTWDNDTSLYGM